MLTRGQPTLRFAHSPALRTRTNKVLSAIDTSPDPTKQAQALSAVVLSLTEAGMKYYFIKPVKEAKLNFIATKAASLGVAGALQVMSPIVRTVIGGANPTQLRVVSAHIRRLMQ